MLSFLQKMIKHLLQIRVLQIHVLQIRVLQIQFMFYNMPERYGYLGRK